MDGSGVWEWTTGCSEGCHDAMGAVEYSGKVVVLWERRCFLEIGRMLLGAMLLGEDSGILRERCCVVGAQGVGEAVGC